MKILKKFHEHINVRKNAVSKNLFFTALLIAGFSTIAFAQTGSGFGIKGGLNYGGSGDYFESIGNNFENPDQNLGYHLGVFGKIGDKIFLRPELVYTKLKSEYDSGNFELTKLDAPILIGIKVLGPVNVFAGPSFQYILDTEFDNLTIDQVEDDFSVGLNFGIGLSLNDLGIELRYERGFSDNEATFINNNITTGDRLDTRPEQLILSLSYKL
ncbi:porin family protein [Winogradskyella litorisediminis]|uniref:Porin family protein n=1 Tax=Winogradskyella litorisediminis TaxID=1156618 RepID=A0ABW3N7H0_9FLAO